MEARDLSDNSPTAAQEGRVSGLDNLPFELVVLVFSFLDVRALLSLAGASRQLHQMANDRVVWRQLCVQHFGDMLAVRSPVSDATKAEEGQSTPQHVEGEADLEWHSIFKFFVLFQKNRNNKWVRTICE